MNDSTQKDISIDYILDKGLQKKRSLWSMLTEIYRTLGFRLVFWDTAQAFVLTALTLTGLLLFLPFSAQTLQHTLLFGCSPLLFVVVVFFSETIERVDGLYELKLTCKYTIRQIVAFRILFFSLLGIVFSVGLTVYSANNSFEVLRLLPLSLSALFICSFICLSLVRRFSGKLTYAIAALLWAVISFVPALAIGEKWELFLSGLPVAITVCVLVLSCVLFLVELKKYMVSSHKEDMIYAVG